ncbi:hypothetical protein K502DRAFT_364597 [Neoconidiobolus thromboides FSU 785]|nr:hypothetical protein K502DRAFT_364597 [Neoconidiobolus thromboides FSU 785]
MAKSIYSVDSFGLDSLQANEPGSSVYSLYITQQPHKTRDDCNLSNYSTYTTQTDSVLNFITPCNTVVNSDQSYDGWEPLVALRHTAQQIMIKNLIKDFSHRPTLSSKVTLSSSASEHRTSLTSSFSITSSDFSLSSNESIVSNQPISPTASEFFFDIYESIQPPLSICKESDFIPISLRERSLSHSGDYSEISKSDEPITSSFIRSSMYTGHTSSELSQRQRSASIATMNTDIVNDQDLSLRYNSKTAVRSSVKASKLLGIESMARQRSACELKPRVESLPTARSISMTNSNPLSPPKTSKTNRASLAAKSLKDMMNSKIGSFKRTHRPSMPSIDDVSIKSVTKGHSALIEGWAEVYKGQSSGFKSKPKWKKQYLVLNQEYLYLFEDLHPTTITNEKIKLTPATIICVSDSIPNYKWVLEIADSYQTNFIRLNGKMELLGWLRKLKEASNLAKFTNRSLPLPPPQIELDFIQNNLDKNINNSDDIEVSSTSSELKNRSFTIVEQSTKDNYKRDPYDVTFSKSNRSYKNSPAYIAYPSLAEVPEC